MENEILRPFLDWDVDAVCIWVSNLALSKDYRNIFWERQITGATLVELDREELEEMGILDGADRLKILQHITSMKGDLLTSGKASPTKRRRISSTTGTTRCIGNEIRWPKTVENGLQSSACNGQATSRRMSGNSSPTKYVNILIRDSCPQTPDSVALSMGGDSQGILSADSQGCLSMGQTTSSESRDSSRTSSPDNSHKLRYRGTPASASSHSIISSTGSRGELRSLSKLQSMATLRAHNVKRLSRSLNNLFPEGEDIFSLYQKSVAEEEEEGAGDMYHPTSNRLVEILREENASLKQELETYYQRVRKLQKIEQEVEHIREAHRVLEAGTVRREGLEKALRLKLEEEVRRLKEETISLKAEVRGRKDSGGNLPDEKKTPKREIRRRDTMITRLIKQNKDAALAREQLEKDLQLARSQLEQQIQENRRITSRTSGSDPAGGHAPEDPETERQIAQVYSESIEKLRGVLSAMLEMSQKRERLEKKLRSQLEGEIRRLKGGVASSPPHSNMESEDWKKTVAELQTRNTCLTADCVKWEQKCLELTAEKQMAYETAVIPRDARIASLERSLAEKIDTLHDVQHQKVSYMSQLTEAKRQTSELEIRLASAKSSLQEKDSVIQMMQSSFLEPDDEKASLTPPQNGVYPPPRGNSNDTHTVTYQPVADVSPAPPSPVKAVSGKPPSISPLPLHGAGSRSPRSLSKQTTVPPSTRNNSPKHRSQSASPVKSVAGGNARHPQQPWPGGISTTANGFSSREPAAPNRRNGYTTHSLCSGGNKFTSSPSSPPSHSNGSNNFRGSPHHHHKPRISHSNFRLLQIPGASADHLGQTSMTTPYRQSHGYNTQRKANTGPSGMRRSNYQRPPSPRVVKSKTPPPDYHLVSSGRKNSYPKEMSIKQRHKSVDDILSSGIGSGQPQQIVNGYKHLNGGSSYDLHHIPGMGDSAVPLPVSGMMRTGFGGSTHLGRVSNSLDYLNGHHHSSSATSHDYPYILAPS